MPGIVLVICKWCCQHSRTDNWGATGRVHEAAARTKETRSARDTRRGRSELDALSARVFNSHTTNWRTFIFIFHHLQCRCSRCHRHGTATLKNATTTTVRLLYSAASTTPQPSQYASERLQLTNRIKTKPIKSRSTRRCHPATASGSAVVSRPRYCFVGPRTN